MCLDTYCDINSVVSTTVFITQINYIGYIFRLLNSHFQAYSSQVKLQSFVLLVVYKYLTKELLISTLTVRTTLNIKIQFLPLREHSSFR